MNISSGSTALCDFHLLTDDALMSFLKEGQPEALAVLFDRYRRLVLSVAWQILRDRGEAEDLMQSVFLEILQSASKFDSAKGTAKSWILQYAYHRSFNRKKYLNLRGITKHSESFSPTQELAAPAPWCSGSFELAESERFVQEALARLNGKQRRILELAFYEGLSMREAAERTGQSFNTVRHHFYRAIGNLRTIMHSRPERPSEEHRNEVVPIQAVQPFAPPQRATHSNLRGLRRTSQRHARIARNLRPEIGKAALARV